MIAIASPAPRSQYTVASLSLRAKPAAASALRVMRTKSAEDLISKQSALSLRHAEGRRGLVVADARSDHHHQVARLDLLLLQRVVERHRDAGGAGVAALLHHRVRLRHRQSEVLH